MSRLRALGDALFLALVTVLALVTAPLWGSWLAFRRLRDGVWPIFIAALLAVTTLASCGGPPRAAQVAISTTAEGLALVDVAVAERIPEAAASARAAALELHDLAAGLAAYDAAMHPWTVVERTMLEAKSALLALQSAYDAWAAGVSDGKRVWLDAVACALPALDELVEVLDRAGVHAPPQVMRAARLLVAFAGGSCPAPATTDATEVE